MFVVPALLIPSFAPQASAQDRPPLPAYSTAADDGALSIWSNPANIAFDPDPTFGLIYAQDLDESAPSAVGLANQAGPLGLGFSYRSGPNVPAWWSVTSALGIKLAKDLTVGAAIGWQLPEGVANNFTTFDLGLGYRPISWLGVGAAVTNLGGELEIPEMTKGSLVLRPFQDTLLIGGEIAQDRAHPDADPIYTGTLRLRPIAGLVLRGSGASDGTVGGGIELTIDGSTIGSFADKSVDDASAPTGLSVYLQNDEPDVDLFHLRKKVAEIAFDGPLPYQPPSGIFARDSESYLDMLERLHDTANDSAVKGVYLKLEDVRLSFAQIEELRTAIADVRSHGKVVVALLDREASNAAYMLATAADKIYLHPAGSLELVGLGAEMQFYRSALDLVGVQPQVVRRAEYKTFYEQYSNTESSPENREEMNALLDDLYAYMVKSVASGRNKTEDDVRTLIDQGPYTPTEAKEKGLIDGIAYPDDLEDDLDSDIPGADYLDDHYRLARNTPAWPAAREIAVIYVDGAIMSGPSRDPGFFGGGTNAGSDTLVAQLEAAKDSDRVKGVLLRVDSPGGSAFASDEIWKAMDEVMQEKPVVVSMGGVAASGGYWVSSTATAIYADETTITGSIGVIGAKMSLGDLYGKVGVHTEFYNRGRNASMNSSSKPWDDVELAAVDRMIGDTYEAFKRKVSEGRNLSLDAVDTIARGRVWSGTDAKERGLVDEIGGFDAAVERVRTEAGLRSGAHAALISYDRGFGGDQTPMSREVRAVRTALFPTPHLDLPPELATLAQFDLLGDETVWAMMPYRLDVH